MKTQPQWVQIAARDELRDFLERYPRDAAAADTTAQNAYREAYDLVKNHPSRRAPDKKVHALEILGQARNELGEAIQKLSARPAYRASNAENLRQKVIEYFQAQSDLLGLCENYLREGQNLINANERALQEQQAKVEELRKSLFDRH
jgi:hypothetical protein